MARFMLSDFIGESNRIEGILRLHTQAEYDATKQFLAEPVLTTDIVTKLVTVYQPDARLRSAYGLNVRVGNHVPPLGGPKIAKDLADLLECITAGKHSPYVGHCLYETLHPFTDGNGRSGRAIWLWAMGGMDNAPLRFLHHFYYQSLDGFRHNG